MNIDLGMQTSRITTKTYCDNDAPVPGGRLVLPQYGWPPEPWAVKHDP